MQKLSLKFLLILKTIPVCSSAAVLSDESHLIISNLLAPEMAPKHCETAGVVLCANTLTHHVLTGWHVSERQKLNQFDCIVFYCTILTTWETARHLELNFCLTYNKVKNKVQWGHSVTHVSIIIPTTSLSTVSLHFCHQANATGAWNPGQDWHTASTHRPSDCWITASSAATLWDTAASRWFV